MSFTTDRNKVLQIQLVHPKAKMPSKGSVQAAGFDLYSIETVLLPSGKFKLINTGLRVKIPQHCYGRIAPRSGLACNYGLDVLAGVIDRDYRGEIQVMLINHHNRPYLINEGERIAQLILEVCSTPEMIEVDTIPFDTSRGEGGYGSTGKF